MRHKRDLPKSMFRHVASAEKRNLAGMVAATLREAAVVTEAASKAEGGEVYDEHLIDCLRAAAWAVEAWRSGRC